MRGKAIDFSFGVVEDRITPAYAGKSNAEEKTAELDTGSPPPMRGKVTDFRKVKGSGRITPAYAGKSKFIFDSKVSLWDHPRLCGEKFQEMLHIHLH